MQKKWFYPVAYLVLIVISMLPPYTQIPYDPQDSQQVIFEILQVSIQPYAAWGWIFHLGTLLLVGLAVGWQPRGGRLLAAYFGLNYLLIAALQTNATTQSYGFAVQTGALLATAGLGLLWLWAAWKEPRQFSFTKVPGWRWWLFPFAVLVFWSPIVSTGSGVVFDFNPLLLLTSPDYGLTYCFMTPVFLFLLILAYPNVHSVAYRLTAFNALIYALYNLVHWSNPAMVVMGIMHLPLLVLSLVALFLPRLHRHPTSRSS